MRAKKENALPWDQIIKAKYQSLADISTDVSYLNSLHQQRIVNNAEFKYLLTDIEEYKAEKDNKSISLNIDERKKKRKDRKAKQLIRANERLLAMGMKQVESLEDLPDELDELDPFLDETAKITFDLISLGHVAKQ